MTSSAVMKVTLLLGLINSIALFGRILYTGDFRYDSHLPLTELSSLHDR